MYLISKYQVCLVGKVLPDSSPLLSFFLPHSPFRFPPIFILSYRDDRTEARPFQNFFSVQRWNGWTAIRATNRPTKRHIRSPPFSLVLGESGRFTGMHDIRWPWHFNLLKLGWFDEFQQLWNGHRVWPVKMLVIGIMIPECGSSEMNFTTIRKSLLTSYTSSARVVNSAEKVRKVRTILECTHINLLQGTLKLNLRN